MTESTEPDPRKESGTEEQAREDDSHAGGAVGGQGGEGSGAAAATPDIGDEGEIGQTSVPAPDDDTGVPSDEELGNE